jgi:hypothetical protein
MEKTKLTTKQIFAENTKLRDTAIGLRGEAYKLLLNLLKNEHGLVVVSEDLGENATRGLNKVLDRKVVIRSFELDDAGETVLVKYYNPDTELYTRTSIYDFFDSPISAISMIAGVRAREAVKEVMSKDKN